MLKQRGGLLSVILPILKAAVGIAAASGALVGLTNQAVKKMSRKGEITMDTPVKEVKLMITSTSQIENNNILPRGTTEMIKHKTVNEQEGGFIGTLLASLALLPELWGGGDFLWLLVNFTNRKSE